MHIIFILVLLNFSLSFTNTEEKLNEEFPNFPFIAHKLSYENDLIKNFENMSFRVIDSNDKSFRANILTIKKKHLKNNVDLVVAFRGTEINEWSNIFADMDILTVNIGGICGHNCHVHKGFNDAYLSVRKQLIEFLNEEIMKLNRNNINIDNLYYTGHSLGGALATVGVYDFLNKRSSKFLDNKYFKLIKNVSLITFGSPRVGNENFRDFMNKKDLLRDSLRVVYGEDIIPSTVVGKPLAHYRHLGDLAYFTQNNFDYPVVYSRYEVNEFTEPEKSFLDRLNFIEKIKDHRKYYLINPKGIEFALKYERP